MWISQAIKGQPLQRFGQPVHYTDEDGMKDHYMKDDDQDEKYIPSKSLNVEKQSHNIPISVSAQTAMNVGMTLICKECMKPWLLYAKQKLKVNELQSFKCIVNDILYICGTPLKEIDENEENRD